MEWTSLNDIREKYLAFFESKGHLRHKSFPLVPQNDKSLLLINAGMAPLKKYFTGEETPPRKRMTTCQKCIRTPDIERVGITARHGTFFEMLGNFSFGDYFKEDAIIWAWEFITEVLKLPKDRLWATIYLDDDEAYNIWATKTDIDHNHIVRLGKEDNFWEIGSGPCGPCSEIHFDRGEKYGCGSPDCKPGCDCDRFMEFWNLVFTQFDGDGNGNYTPLANPNIDTGSGLERVACVMQGVNNLFEVDTIQNIMKAVCEKANITYGASASKTDISLRVITDHIRSTMFLIGDGVLPSNEGRGYVLRRLLRRAARHGRLLGISGAFLHELCPVVAKENITAYPELTEKLDYIQKVIRIEEERFIATVESGSAMLDDLIAEAKKENRDTLFGKDVFKLSDTYGYPIDLTREIAAESGLKIDEEEFKALMKEQKERARAARANLSSVGWEAGSVDMPDVEKTVFKGYENNSCDAQILAIIDENGENVGCVTDAKATLILNETPFYAESGGQIGDTGVISGDGFSAKVIDTQKTAGGLYLHVCEISGTANANDNVKAEIDVIRRERIRRNHSSVHLLQAALRQILGTHVEQSGSYVSETRMRFDFSHFAPMTAEEIEKAESIVNAKIFDSLNIDTLETDIETARKNGAMALFGEKYGDKVRMVSMGDFSIELCGGTHAKNTAQLGLFKIISESSVAAGVRRIEATTSFGVMELLANDNSLLAKLAQSAKVSTFDELPRRIEQLQEDVKSLKSTLQAQNAKILSSKIAEAVANAKQIGELKAVCLKTEDLPADVIRNAGDELKANHSDITALISVSVDGKHNLLCVCGKDALAKKFNASNVLRELASILGGGGGGRPDSAMGGVKNIERMDEAFDKFYDIVKNIQE